MQRVLGVETEYGLSAHAGGRRLSAPEAAELLFRPLVAEYRSSDVFLANGGRLYLDVGAHPEYATPECRSVAGLLVAERAGDELVAGLAARASALAAEAGAPVRFRVFKNNADAYGNSWGCHENYLVSRGLELEAAVGLLASFLVTRQVLCGAGRLSRGVFLLSQRADHLHEAMSALTTRLRPLVNTRDEPLADPARFRRLHVLAGDSNLVEPSARLKVATAAAVLDLVDRPGGPDPRLEACRLADPADALRKVARDPLARLVLADGRTVTAVDVQRAHLELVAGFAAPELVATWARVLDAVAAGTPGQVADIVEWAARRQLLEAYRDRHGLVWDDPRLAQLDLAFAELGGPVRTLEAGGAVARLTDPDAVARAHDDPPEPTRARARSAFLRGARASGRPVSVDWRRCTVHAPAGDRTVLLDDPLDAAFPDLAGLLADP